MKRQSEYIKNHRLSYQIAGITVSYTHLKTLGVPFRGFFDFLFGEIQPRLVVIFITI